MSSIRIDQYHSTSITTNIFRQTANKQTNTNALSLLASNISTPNTQSNISTMSFAKPQVLFLATKLPKGGPSLQPFMDKTLKTVREDHGERISFDGLLLDDDKSHDDQLRNLLDKTKFDVISIGGGIKLASESWEDRVQSIIGGSQSKDAKITKPQGPEEGVRMAIEAAKEFERK